MTEELTAWAVMSRNGKYRRMGRDATKRKFPLVLITESAALTFAHPGEKVVPVKVRITFPAKVKDKTC